MICLLFAKVLIAFFSARIMFCFTLLLSGMFRSASFVVSISFRVLGCLLLVESILIFL